MARFIIPQHYSGPQNEGERRTIEYLMDTLPPTPAQNGWRQLDELGPEYIIIPNLDIPDSANDKFLEVDALIIAPHCVYVCEFKHWIGVIDGNDHSWFINQKQERPNPHKLLGYKTKVVRGVVGQKSADLSYKVWFQHVVIIADPKTALNLGGVGRDNTFCLNDDLIRYLKDPQRLSTHKPVAPDAIKSFQREIAEIVIGYKKPASAKELVFHGYKVEEELSATEGLVEYLAKSVHGHLAGSYKRLRVFKIPAYLDAAAHKKRKDKIMRDYLALETIGTHPNIVSLKGFYDENSNQVVEVLDWSEMGTLRSLLDNNQGRSLTLDQKIDIVKGIANGLKAASDKNIFHRDLRPENVMMTANGPQVMNFDKAYMEGGELQTVWQTVSKDQDRRYLPPELALPSHEYDVFPFTDLYSLGAIFYELLCGNLPFNDPSELKIQPDGELPYELLPSVRIPGLPDWLDKIVKRMYVGEYVKRYANIREFLDDLHKNMVKSQSEPEEERTPDEETLDPNRIFQTGERIGDYRIVKNIGQGGFAQVYLATHVLHDTEYALKVYNHSVPLSSLIDEFQYLNQLNHPNIVKVSWSGQLPGDRYYLAMEYLKGETLKSYAWGSKKLPVMDILIVGQDILRALRYLHEPEQKQADLKGKIIFHRDVKPNNIVWVPERGFVLIDFNVAKKADENETFVGTNPYIAPDLIKGTHITWNASGDLFALGITLYEMICKKHPYPDKQPQVHLSPIHPDHVSEGMNLSKPVADFIYRAVQPKKDDRFATAQEMEKALLEVMKGPIYDRDSVVCIDQKPDTEISDRPNYNPFVDQLRRLFSQARVSNAGTRGLDEVAQKTYIDTRLDKELVPAILDGSFKLVIITGNAGDGKTALIQQLECQAEKLHPLPTKNGSRFVVRGTWFQSNYDGSQDEGDKDNDQVLEEFLSPFAGKTRISEAEEGRILAINEGRLIEFLSHEERKERFGFLYEIIDDYFNEHGEGYLPDKMMLINLNWRSIVARNEDHDSILEKQLQAILKPELWKKCHTCDLRNQCFIRYNVTRLSDSAAGPEIRARLRDLLEVVHLRRKLHITMRDLRSAISFLICRDFGCEDIPKLIDNFQDPENQIKYVSLAYWNISDPGLEDSGDEDRFIRLIREVDVGQVAHPELDRELHFTPLDDISYLVMENQNGDYIYDLLKRIQQHLADIRVDEISEDIKKRSQNLHRLLVRKQYFESLENKTNDRLPYRHLGKFLTSLEEESDSSIKARNTIIKALSLNEGCSNPILAEDNICLASTNEKDPRYSSYRLFEKSEFDVYIPRLDHLTRYLEVAPDRFIFRHSLKEGIELEVNLDLFEMLAYVADGFIPSLNDINGRYVELIIFKNSLLHLPYRSLTLTEDHHNFYQIHADDENRLIFKRINHGG